MKIMNEGYVYSSRQNGLVLNPRGISPTISVGQHSGVEPRIRVVYEKGQSGSDCEPDNHEAEKSAETEGVLHGGTCSERGHDDGGGNLEPLIPVIYESDKLREQRTEQRRLGQGQTPADAGDELRQVLQRRDELAEGLYDSNGL